MKQAIAKENIITHKKQAIRKLNNLLENYISTEEPKFLKKTNLISYWLENFVSLHIFGRHF